MASEEDKKKIIIAVVLLALAGASVAWSMGLFSGGEKKPSAPMEAPKDAAGKPRGGGARTVDGSR